MASNVLTKEKVFVQKEEANSSSTVVQQTPLDNSTRIDDRAKYDLANKISQDILESPFVENPTFNPSNFSSVDEGNNPNLTDTPLSDMNFTAEANYVEGQSKKKKIIIYSTVSILILILGIVVLEYLDTPSFEQQQSLNDKKQINSLITEEKINDNNVASSTTTTDNTSTVTDKETTTNDNNISLLPEGVKKYIPDSMNQKLEEFLYLLGGTKIKKYKKTTKRTIVKPSNQEQAFVTGQSGINPDGVITNADNSTSTSNSSLDKRNINSNNSSSNSSLANSNNTTTNTTTGDTVTNNTYNTYSGASNSKSPNDTLDDNTNYSTTSSEDPNSYNEPTNTYDGTTGSNVAQDSPSYQDVAPQKPRVYGTERANSTPYTKDLPTSTSSHGNIPDNPYWNLPNRIFKDTSNISTADVNEVRKYQSNMNNAFNYQRYKTILEVKAMQKKGTEKVLVAGSKEPKLWSRMNAIMGLADIGYELDISEVETALNNERSTLISGFFRRYAARENVTEGELYILRQSIKVTDPEARYNILRALSRWDNNLADLYFVAASYDPSNKIKNYANRFLRSRNLDEETMELYRNIITGETEVDFMLEDEKEGVGEENISQNTNINNSLSIN